jgi:hypothetical protein
MHGNMHMLATHLSPSAQSLADLQITLQWFPIHVLPSQSLSDSQALELRIHPRGPGPSNPGMHLQVAFLPTKEHKALEPHAFSQGFRQTPPEQTEDGGQFSSEEQDPSDLHPVLAGSPTLPGGHLHR